MAQSLLAGKPSDQNLFAWADQDLRVQVHSLWTSNFCEMLMPNEQPA